MPDWGTTSLLIVTAAFTAANWVAIWRGKFSVYYATKPFVLLGFIAVFILNGSIDSFRLAFLLGLEFSLLGDVLLIPQGKRWFLAGMGAFAVAQVFYIIGFNASLPSIPVLVIGTVGFLAGALILHLATDRLAANTNLSQRFLWLVKTYSFLVLAMAISAVLCLDRPGWSDTAALMAGIGGYLFLVSDIMIGLDKLDRRLPRHKFWIIVTYHVGQFLITAAVLTFHGTFI